MRVLIGQLVVDERPDLVEFLAHDSEVELFNPFALAGNLVEQFERFEPDVIVVGVAMLDVLFVFQEIVRRAGCSAVKIVVAVRNVDDVLKVRVAHAGFHEVVGVGRPIVEIADMLRDLVAGRSSFDTDRLWTSVRRPKAIISLDVVPRDTTDKQILRLLAIGLSDIEIARSVHASTQTIRNRVSSMLIRSGIDNRTQLAWMYSNQKLTERMIQGIEYGSADS